MHLTLKRAIGNCFGWAGQRSSRKAILIYHALGTSELAVPLKSFEEQIAWLKSNVDVVSLEELLIRDHGHKIQVSITFDDAYGSVFDSAFPLLGRYGLVASVYANSACISDGARNLSDPSKGHYPAESFMTWSDLKKLCDAGWSIGGHGVDHVDLTRLDPDAVAFQLEECKKDLEQQLDCPCKEFAYTWGRHSCMVRQAVRDAGYSIAVAGLHRPVTADSDICALPRLDVRADYTLSDFKNVVRGAWDFLGLIQKWRGHQQ
jgi:peptidoglycan/xylan/chitin deacetylase (PgdA/CDA1 family)